MEPLDTPLREIAGPKTADAFAQGFAVDTVGDLLHHYPRRYDERGRLTNLAALRPGEHVTVLAEVVKVHGRQLRAKLHKLDVTVTDGTRSLTLTFFNQRWRQKTLRPGRTALFAGKVEVFRRPIGLTNPDCQPVDGADGLDPDEYAGALIPVYPATVKLPTWIISRTVRLALDYAFPPGLAVVDPLPAELRARHRLVDLPTAIRRMHCPADRSQVHDARRRLTWDEALVLQLVLARRRAAARGISAAPRPAAADGLLAAFDARLPFVLTAGQRAVGKQIAADLGSGHPMQRLLQGEVGSGKTVVALRAMLQVVDAGGQAALLAPTEVLAVQHIRTLAALLGPLGRAGQLDGAERATGVALLTGALGAAARRRALAAAADGSAGLVVGTHALLTESVVFHDLGLVVVDEQHRFGVEQRDVLRSRAEQPPHVLVMTATPIPRTVAMTVYGDLEVSSLTELPAGRAPVGTTIVPVDHPGWLDRAWARVREEVGAGRRAYVVCPRIGDGDDGDGDDGDGDEPDSDAAEGAGGGAAVDGSGNGDAERATRGPAAAVLDVAAMLAAGPLHGLRLGVLHGRLPMAAKDAAMRDFASGQLDVLVATTVIEVGVDVPEASVMVVLDADRFGISQLHQLRGRVGRGGHPGLCLLVTASRDSPAGERLAAVAATTDGVELALLDLRQRREGDVLSALQAGRRSSLRLLSVLDDGELIAHARREATALVDGDPELSGHPALARAAAVLAADDRADYLEKA